MSWSIENKTLLDLTRYNVKCLRINILECAPLKECVDGMDDVVIDQLSIEWLTFVMDEFHSSNTSWMANAIEEKEVRVHKFCHMKYHGDKTSK